MSMTAYRDWMVARALPVWSSIGYDGAARRFRERLDHAGRPIDVPHRAMVQARQIYVFAHAAELGWFAGAELAEGAMASLLRDYYAEGDGQGSFAFSVDGGGAIVSATRDAYTQAFALFAIAWLYRLNGDRGLLDIADRTLAFIDARLTDPIHGGLFDSAPVDTRDKRQNPLMHLLEACLFLAQAAPERSYLDRAAGLVALFEQRLFRDPPGILIEHFTQDWADHADHAKADMFEPGHHFEWVWLLDRYARQTGEDMTRWSEPLYLTACRHGIAPSGQIFDEVGGDMRVRKASHRVWPHTEAIKAAVARHRHGDAGARCFAEAMAARLLETFLDRPFAGGWIDHVGADGAPLVGHVPASSLYHLFLAAAESASLPVDTTTPIPEPAQS